MADVRISDRLTDLNSMLIPRVSNLKASWELSRAGQLTFDIPVSDLPASLSIFALKGKWIRYSHPTLGAWGGSVTSVDPSNGLLSVSCESWAANLRHVVTTGTQQSVSISQAVQNIIQDVATLQPHGILRGEFWWSGNNFILPADAQEADQDIYDVFLPRFMDLYHEQNGIRILDIHGPGWNVDPVTRAFNFEHQYGQDLSATVTLADRVHNISSSWADDAEDVFNRLTLYATHNAVEYITEAFQDVHQVKNKDYKKGAKGKKGQKYIDEPFTNYRQVPQTVVSATPVVARVSSSQTALGTRNIKIAQPGVPYGDLAQKQAAAVALATYYSRDEQLVEIECEDRNQVWLQFREGDIIMADLSNDRARGRMVVRTRAYDDTRGTLLVTGEALLS